MFSGAGLMLLLNCCIAFTVDNVRRSRKTRRNRNSSIIRRPPRQQSVSFSEPLVTQPRSNQKRTAFQSSQMSPQEIEMVDLRAIPPQTSTLTKQRKPSRPAPPPPAQMSRPIGFPNFPPPPVPTLNRSRAPSLRSLTTRRAPPPPVVPTPSAATLPRQTRHVQSAQASGMQAQAVPSRSAMNLPGLPGQSQSAQSFGMQAQQAVPIVQSATTLPRPIHSAHSFGMQGQQAVPIVQSAMPNTTFPRAAGKKRSRNDDLSQNPLFQKCLQNNSK